MKNLAALSLVALVCAGCGTPQPASSGAEIGLDLPTGWEEASKTILAADLLKDVSTIGSDEFEGRLPGSPGDTKTRDYLVSRLSEMGLEPAFGEDQWEQPFNIFGIEAHMPETWTFRGPSGEELSYRFADEYMAASGLQQPSVDVENAEVVFVGYGIQAPEENWDDYKGVDLKGKMLLMLNGDPHWQEGLFGGERKLYYGRWSYKYESAARQGAAGAIIIHTTPSAGYGWEVVRSSWLGEQFELEAGDEPRIGVKGWLTEDSARSMVALGGQDLDELVEAARSRDFKPVPVGTTTSLHFDVSVNAAETANVGGILRGSDPEVADEIFVYSAHHDHLGIGEPDETGDVIYNGARDNGVAMSQALAMAKAYRSLPEPPRRSMLILFVAGEEQGFLGSSYFANSGVIHPGKMVANINFEMGNIWGTTRDVTVYGLGKSTLDDFIGKAAATQDRILTAEKDVRAGWFYRSDQISFARVGVPAIWFMSGTDFIGRPEGWGEERHTEWIRNHYHRPSDEVTDQWVLDGLAQDAKLSFMVGAAVMTTDTPPAWFAGDEFEDERLASLAELE